jgi:hypothetical protein
MHSDLFTGKMADARRNVRGSRMIRFLITVSLTGCLLAAQASALTLEELQGDAKLNPKKFAKHFADFAYLYGEEVQPPQTFLLLRAGDCDDYAVLADLVLKPKGFKTRLILVRMPGRVTHAVCYVDEEKGYLDYNNRVYLLRVERAGSSLRDIAAKVAKSFDANWTSASEFTYLGGSMKKLITTVAKTDPP